MRLTEPELLQAFRLIDGRTSAAGRPLATLRKRLIGELLGDVDLVAETLADGFELITYASGAATTTGRDRVLASVRRMAGVPGGSYLWLELEELLCDDGGIAARGELRTLTPTAPAAELRTVTTMPIALFLRFDGDLMVSETIYLATAASRTDPVPGGALPSPQHLRAVLLPEAAAQWS